MYFAVVINGGGPEDQMTADKSDGGWKLTRACPPDLEDVQGQKNHDDQVGFSKLYKVSWVDFISVSERQARRYTRAASKRLIIDQRLILDP